MTTKPWMAWALPLLVSCSALEAVSCNTSEAPRVVAEAHPALSPPPKWLIDAQIVRLQALSEELARPPFGTASVLSVSRGGRTLSYAAGTLWEGGPATKENTRFNWASVSKLLTAGKVAALAHDGRLSLDDSVKQHLPGVVLMDAGGTDRASEISLRQLLMHRGGVPHQPAELDPHSVGSDWGDPDLLRKLTSSWSVALREQPGNYSYSNIGYALLAAVIEKIEGVNFVDAMQPYLQGLEMQNSTFWSGDITEGAAHGRVERNGSVLFNAPGWYTSRYALPFTGLWATAPDMARFGEALIAAHADATRPLHTMTTLDSDVGHGAGPVHRKRFGARSLEHDGGGPGFTALLLAIPEHDITLAIVCNGDGNTGANAKRLYALTDEVLEVILNAEEPPPGTTSPSRAEIESTSSR